MTGKYKQTYKKAEDILCNLDHGECLYVEDEFNELIKDIDELKRLAKEEYEENQKEE